jgi:hypothetical protein
MNDPTPLAPSEPLPGAPEQGAKPADGSPSAAPTTYAQPWIDQVWNVVAASSGLAKHIFSAAPAQFRLEKTVTANGSPAYAVRPAVETKLPTCFESSVVLTPAGTMTVDSIEAGPLPAFSDSVLTKYWDASHHVLRSVKKHSGMSSRLEGRVRWCGAEHTVCLYQVQRGLADGRSFLVLDIKEDNGTKNPDGAAIGHN